MSSEGSLPRVPKPRASGALPLRPGTGAASGVTPVRPHAPAVPGLRATLMAEAVYIGLLLPLPWVLDKPELRWLFSEAGPFERLSALFWVLLGLCSLALLRTAGWRARLTCGLAAWIGAARELDLHTALTGTSLFKSSYYLHAPAAAGEKWMAAALALAVLAVLADVARLGLLALRDPAQRQRESLRIAGLALAITLATKLADKLQSFVHDVSGHWLPQTASLTVEALEEGVEMSLPLLFLVALLRFRREAGTGTTAPHPVPWDGRP